MREKRKRKIKDIERGEERKTREDGRYKRGEEEIQMGEATTKRGKAKGENDWTGEKGREVK